MKLIVDAMRERRTGPYKWFLTYSMGQYFLT